MLYRALDAVELLREQGLDVGLVNKPTLNSDRRGDAQRASARARSCWSPRARTVNTGLGARFGTWLLARGLTPRYDYLGTTRSGSGGLWEQMPYQGLDPEAIARRARELAAKKQ